MSIWSSLIVGQVGAPQPQGDEVIILEQSNGSIAITIGGGGAFLNTWWESYNNILIIPRALYDSVSTEIFVSAGVTCFRDFLLSAEFISGLDLDGIDGVSQEIIDNSLTLKIQKSLLTASHKIEVEFTETPPSLVLQVAKYNSNGNRVSGRIGPSLGSDVFNENGITNFDKGWGRGTYDSETRKLQLTVDWTKLYGQTLKEVVSDIPDGGSIIIAVTASGGQYASAIFGTAISDDILGGTSSEDIYGLGGADKIDAESGNDLVDGGDGNDIIDGGDGDDELIGGAGNDYLDGGDGIDCAEYEISRANLTINFQSGIATGADIGTDTLVNIEEACAGAGNDLITGLLESSSKLEGGDGNDTLITGNKGDFLYGGNGNDVLIGGGDIDLMEGGKGNDTYVIDRSDDIIIELEGEGVDTVRSTIIFSIADLPEIENLTLLGAENIDATGNININTLIGNAGNNTLDGGLGTDRMQGGVGNDTYIVDNISDVVIETSGANSENDTIFSSISYRLGVNVENLVLTGTSSINGIGNSTSNSITGNSGNNILNGGLGADQMSGGDGDDTYIVDSVGDSINESSSAESGVDLVQSSVTYTLGNNLENLTLTGTSVINGTGNSVNNILTGNTRNNVLDGKEGVDTLIGGLGNDTYVVDHELDIVIEVSGQGTDLIRSTANSYTLTANVENLTLLGEGDINGRGNLSNNNIQGNLGDNMLDGESGNDVINGNGGDDAIFGGFGNDNLNGGDGFDSLTGISLTDATLGKGSIDRMTGGKDADLFILGNIQGVFYNNGNSESSGTLDCGWITDFKSSEGDKIQLHGQQSDYILKAYTLRTETGSARGMGIYLNDSNGMGSIGGGWDSKDELIGFIQGYTNIVFNSDFTFVQQQVP